MSLKHKVKYGWCHTDYKNGRVIDSNNYHSDYVFGDKYGYMIQSILKEFGLPAPKKEEVYRGTSQDLLFLDSHGLVVRIGPHDVTTLMSSTILQPLGYKLTDKIIAREPLAVSIYPGIKLIKDCYDTSNIANIGETDYLESEVSGILRASGHKDEDVKPSNIGLVEVFNGKSAKKLVPILLDMDGYYNRSNPELADKRNGVIKTVARQNNNQAVIMSAVVNVLAEKNFVLYEDYLKIFNKHQPLREMFWNAANDNGGFDKGKMGAFLDKCAEVTLNPQDMNYSVWSIKKGELTRNEVNKVQVGLYPTWQTKESLAVNNSEARLCL